MKHRVFIAINLPENIKKKLADFERKWPELPARWTKFFNLHITLSFLGYLQDDEILQVCDIVKEIALKHMPFSVNLKRICYGPTDAKQPRMIWIEGEKSEELGKLQKDLENSLRGVSTESKTEQVKGYTPHITLGRLKLWEFRRIEPEEVPGINEEINFNFEVNSIDVMESELKKGGPNYAVLESVPLKS